MNSDSVRHNNTLDNELLDLSRQLNEARNEIAVLNQRLERQTDWYQQRHNAYRKWVENEVRPLSEEVARRYYSIVANGSPAPHESSDWQNTLHGATIRAENAECQLKKVKSELHEIAVLVGADDVQSVQVIIKGMIHKASSEHEAHIQRIDSIIKMADYNAEHMEKHLTDLVNERQALMEERDKLKRELCEVESDYLISERQMLEALSNEFKRGVETMRSEALKIILHNSHEDGPGLGSNRLESAITAIHIEPGQLPQVRMDRK